MNFGNEIFMDTYQVYNIDLKLKYLINDITVLINEINESISDVHSNFKLKNDKELEDISESAINNLKTTLKNNIEYENYVYKKYEAYIESLNESKEILNSILKW